MKLITKASYYYLLLSLVLLVSAGTIFYFYLSRILNEEINEQIEIDKRNIIEYVQKHEELPPSSPLAESIVLFIPSVTVVAQSIKDTALLSPLKDEYLPYRQIIFPLKVHEKFYAVTLNRPLFEKADLLETIAKSLGILIVFLLIVLFLMSRWLSVRLWTPFYHSLNQLKQIEFSANKSLQLPTTTTIEFAQLNEELIKMMERIQKQYRSLKEFSENASHEIQTPLAIIRNKLELLMQTGKYSRNETAYIRDAFESANRLSKLTQSLLLLAKIENRQYYNLQNIDLKKLIIEKVEFFEDIKQIKDLTLELDLKTPMEIKMDPQLSDVLISNILGNAFKYSLEKGQIKIETSGKSLLVSNLGRPLSKPEVTLFNRFTKDSSTSSESPGLGLAIVQQICEIYHFPVNYDYSDGWHKISILFDSDRISPDSASTIVS